MRTCDDCRRYMHHEGGPDAGLVDTCPSLDGGGGVVHLPLLRPAGCAPPCDECPKVAPDEPHKHWSKAAEFAPWFWAAWGWFREARAVGDFGRPDPLMRAVAVEFDRHARHLDARAAAGPLLDGLTAMFAPPD